MVELIVQACEEYGPPCDEFDPDVDWTECYPTPDEPPPEEPPLI